MCSDWFLFNFTVTSRKFISHLERSDVKVSLRWNLLKCIYLKKSYKVYFTHESRQRKYRQHISTRPTALSIPSLETLSPPLAIKIHECGETNLVHNSCTSHLLLNYWIKFTVIFFMNKPSHSNRYSVRMFLSSHWSNLVDSACNPSWWAVPGFNPNTSAVTGSAFWGTLLSTNIYIYIYIYSNHGEKKLRSWKIFSTLVFINSLYLHFSQNRYIKYFLQFLQLISHKRLKSLVWTIVK